MRIPGCGAEDQPSATGAPLGRCPVLRPFVHWRGLPTPPPTRTCRGQGPTAGIISGRKVPARSPRQHRGARSFAMNPGRDPPIRLEAIRARARQFLDQPLQLAKRDGSDVNPPVHVVSTYDVQP